MSRKLGLSLDKFLVESQEKRFLEIFKQQIKTYGNKHNDTI